MVIVLISLKLGLNWCQGHKVGHGHQDQGQTFYWQMGGGRSTEMNSCLHLLFLLNVYLTESG